jgi:cysteine desulfurase
VEGARETIARAIHAQPREIVFTSGATESNNLAIRGVAERRRRGNHLVSVQTEHKAVLDPLARLARRDCQVTLLPVASQQSTCPGLVDLEQLSAAIEDDTFLVSVMLANNEIGVIQPLDEIAALCAERGVLLHTDATQAVGRVPVDVRALQVDLLSLSAHKFYGPKGVGALFVRREGRPVRMMPQIDGGGQESGNRGGTLNVPGIVGMARALALCVEEMDREPARASRLRQRLFETLLEQVPELELNGPPLNALHRRLPGNLNCRFPRVDGQALMLHAPEVAVSSGSACTSANPEPSHVLRALGLDADQVRSSLRFGVGRYNTEDEMHYAAAALGEAVRHLRRLAR